MTGWYRDGKCRTDAWDRGSHTVCAVMTSAFLEYTKSMGNDLSTPRPWGFPGLRPGDRWCLCSRRWRLPGKQCTLARLPWWPWRLHTEMH